LLLGGKEAVATFSQAIAHGTDMEDGVLRKGLTDLPRGRTT